MSEIVEPKIDDVSSVKKRISFEIPWDDVKHELDKVYQKAGKTARIKGFRPGKIPRNIMEKYYRQDVEVDAISNLVNRYYWETIQKHNIAAVSQPQIEQEGIEQEKNFTFTATVDVEPQIEPVGYTGLELEKQTPVVNDDELEANMQQMRQMFAVLENVEEERGVQTGDFVTIGFEGALAGEKLPELKAENHLLEIGSGSFIPGFEEQLIDSPKGATKNIEVTFPADYQAPRLAGKNVQFAVAIKDIRVRRLPDLDDKFIKNFGKYTSLDELRADVRKRAEEEKKKRLDAAFVKQIGDKLLENNIFEAPEAFIEQQVYYMVSDAHSRMVSEGMDPKKAEELAANLRAPFRDEAAKIVKTTILLDKIAQKEAIAATDEELEARIREFALQRSQDYETFRKSLEKDNLVENIRGELINRKTYEFIESKANITVREAEKIESGDAAK
ncbi:MAG: trigger factor [Syntrophales bacterium]|nr:trigger factor [Syntrophales bacterium]